MLSIDVRGFKDALQGLRHQRAWQLDAARARVAQLLGQLAACEASYRIAEDESAAQSACAARFWERRGDPAAYRRLLDYLARVEQHKAHIARQMAALNVDVGQAREVARECQRGVELLEQLRAQALEEYCREQRRAEASQQDQLWLMRVPSQGEERA